MPLMSKELIISPEHMSSLSDGNRVAQSFTFSNMMAYYSSDIVDPIISDCAMCQLKHSSLCPLRAALFYLYVALFYMYGWNNV